MSMRQPLWPLLILKMSFMRIFVPPSLKFHLAIKLFFLEISMPESVAPLCLGRFNIGKVNENGQMLLELCTRFSLCVANSFFDTKPQNNVSWRHPRSKHWHQLDLVLVRRSNLNSVKVVRSYHSADCDIDHLLVCCRMKLSPKKFFLS